MVKDLALFLWVEQNEILTLFAFMRRLVLLSAIVVLSACTRQQALPAEEVLQRAVQTAHTMQSARFAIQGELQGRSANGAHTSSAFTASGWIQNQGEQLQLSFQLKDPNTAEKTIAGQFIMADAQDSYFSLDQMQGSGGFLHHWWKLSSLGNTKNSVVAPDPHLLDLQLSSIDVVHDYGMSEYQGNLSYHYDTQINAERLLAFLAQLADEQKHAFDASSWKKLLSTITLRGSVWIDAQTFHLQRLDWLIEAKEKQQPMRLQVSILLSDFNAAPVVTPPSSAQELPNSLPDVTGQSVSLANSALIRSLLGTPY